MKDSIEGRDLRITLSGRGKRNIPLPIFKNEPTGKITIKVKVSITALKSFSKLNATASGTLSLMEF